MIKIAVFIFTLGFLTLNADIFEDYEYFIMPDGTCRIYDYTGSASYLIITNEIEGLSVTSLAEASFRNSTTLVNVNIPDSISNIFRICFCECTSLTNIYIPSSISHISDYCFQECTSLKFIEIPDSVTSIGNQSFRECSSLLEVKLGLNLRTIGAFCFYKCTNLISADLPEGLISLGIGAFSDCSNLAKIQIPSSVTSIADNCFGGSDITNLTFWCNAPANINLTETLPSNCIIFYDPNKTGFSTPTWQGYACYPLPEPTLSALLVALIFIFLKNK